MLYMITFTINIPQMLAYIPAPWILWDILYLHFFGGFPENHRGYRPGSIVMWRPGSIDERVGFFLGLPRWEVCQHIDCWYEVTVVSEFSELYRISLISVAILLILAILEMCVKA